MPYIQDAVGKFPRFEPRTKSVTLSYDDISARACVHLQRYLTRANIMADVKRNAQRGCTVYYEEAHERALRGALVYYQ